MGVAMNCGLEQALQAGCGPENDVQAFRFVNRQIVLKKLFSGNANQSQRRSQFMGGTEIEIVLVLKNRCQFLALGFKRFILPVQLEGFAFDHFA